MSYKKQFASSIVLVLLIFSLITFVGASSTMWSQTYGGASSDVAYAFIKTSDGGYAIAGGTESFGAGGADFWLVKADSSGNMEWNQTYGGENDDCANALIESSDGGYVLAGGTDSFGAGLYDFWLIKTDATGNMEWNQTYGGEEDDCAYTLIEASGGGYVLAGETSSVGAGEVDFWLIKVDSSGNMEWNQTYGGTAYENVYAIVEVSDGGYVLAGETETFSTLGYDCWLIKTDAAGNMEWNQTYSGESSTGGSAFVQTSDGGYALAGGAASVDGADYDFWLVKTDANGTLLWTQTYGGESYDVAWSIAEASDGGYLIAGGTSSFGAGVYDFWLVKTDETGNMDWNQTYGGESYDVAWSIAEASDGGYILVGETSSFGAGDSDFWLVKTDENGIIPEFPSWILVPLFVTATMVAMLYKKKLKHTIT
ncbi:MAG: hypothetical protein NWF06_10735 [Candidatus Bathyarchaeota archaeon]|nr:hypothetical protein [Candidatus Bathyarchaeum sp.]